MALLPLAGERISAGEEREGAKVMTKNKPTNAVIFAGWQKALAELTRKRQRLQFELGEATREEKRSRATCNERREAR